MVIILQIIVNNSIYLHIIKIVVDYSILLIREIMKILMDIPLHYPIRLLNQAQIPQ